MVESKTWHLCAIDTPCRISFSTKIWWLDPGCLKKMNPAEQVFGYLHWISVDLSRLVCFTAGGAAAYYGFAATIPPSYLLQSVYWQIVGSASTIMNYWCQTLIRVGQLFLLLWCSAHCMERWILFARWIVSSGRTNKCTDFSIIFRNH